MILRLGLTILALISSTFLAPVPVPMTGSTGKIALKGFAAVHSIFHSGNNFLVAELPCPTQPGTQMILFVTARIVENNPIGVKSAYKHFKCNRLGLLLSPRLIKILISSAAPPKTSPFFGKSSVTIAELLEPFRIHLKYSIKLVLVDTVTELERGVLQDLREAGLILFRHPMNILNSNVYFDLPVPLDNVKESQELALKPGVLELNPFDLKAQFEYSLYGVEFTEADEPEEATTGPVPEPEPEPFLTLLTPENEQVSPRTPPRGPFCHSSNSLESVALTAGSRKASPPADSDPDEYEFVVYVEDSDFYA